MLTPTKEEAALLLTGPDRYHDFQICDEALPPTFLLKRAIAAEDGGWSMPRLFCDEVLQVIVGSAVFKSAPKAGRVEVGYGVSPSCHGRGYATAGLALLLEEAFASAEVEEVTAETIPTNASSKRVLEKTGFSFVGSDVNDEGPILRWSKKRSR